jgi:hypothetical protein
MGPPGPFLSIETQQREDAMGAKNLNDGPNPLGETQESVKVEYAEPVTDYEIGEEVSETPEGAEDERVSVHMIFLGMVILIVISYAISGCASVPEANTELEPIAQGHDYVIGADDEGKVIYQTETPIMTEIHIVQIANERLEENLHGYLYELTECRNELISKVTSEHELDTLKETLPVKEEVGMVGDDMKVVKRQDVVQMLEVEKKYNSSLKRMGKLVKRDLRECDRKLRMKEDRA